MNAGVMPSLTLLLNPHSSSHQSESWYEQVTRCATEPEI